jgi:hypothetical protein
VSARYRAELELSRVGAGVCGGTGLGRVGTELGAGRKSVGGRAGWLTGLGGSTEVSRGSNLADGSRRGRDAPDAAAAPGAAARPENLNPSDPWSLGTP